MKADLTRTTFRPFKHYGGVVAQQGRVQLDADFNEQHLIVLHYLRSLAQDVFGPAGGPQPPALGFAIDPLPAGIGTNARDFIIRPGHYYVGGILCELEHADIPITVLQSGSPPTPTNQVQVAALELDGRPLAQDQYVTLFDDPNGQPQVDARITKIEYSQQVHTLTLTSSFAKEPLAPRMRRLVTFLTQPDLPVDPLDTDRFQIYLDVWERVVTYLQDDRMREVALNGPDTSARRKIVWQVRAVGLDSNADPCVPPAAFAKLLQPPNRGRLRARSKPSPASQDPCTIAPDSAYRGPQNQLYRVEIHTGNLDLHRGVLGGPSTAPPTFKWSRENGSVAFAIVSGGGSNTLVLESLGRDERYGLVEGDWVGVEDDASVVLSRTAPLLQVRSIDRSRRSVTLSDNTPALDMAGHPLLRRWDQKQGDPAQGGLTLSSGDHAALIIDGTGTQDKWFDLEDGVQIQFVNPSNATYRAGDYWLIPARVATGDVEWPTETVPVAAQTTTRVPLALPPHGVDHHYAPLAVFSFRGAASARETDCRMVIPSLVKSPTPQPGTGPGQVLPPDTPGPEGAILAARPRARKRRTASPEA